MSVVPSTADCILQVYLRWPMSKRWKVLISTSHDIYLNLAWEDWLYKKMNFVDQNVLLLWRNKPCVVIGRYQNPWKEVDVDACNDLSIPIARRFSGGGTVYHDMGNINFTFMTERKLYDRRRNLEFIVSLLKENYGIRAEVNKRDDIVVDGKLKVSGTAAKLGRLSAYHHCTLLVNVRKHNLRSVLSPKKKGISTTATESLPSPTVNLSQVLPGLTCEDLIHDYAKSYAALDTAASPSEWIEEVSPDERGYPGISATADDLQSDAFIWYGTPKFNIIRDFALPPDSRNSGSSNLSLNILVEKGIVTEAQLDGNLPETVKEFAQNVLSSYRSMPFEAVRKAALSHGTTSYQAQTAISILEKDFVQRCIVRALSLQE